MEPRARTPDRRRRPHPHRHRPPAPGPHPPPPAPPEAAAPRPSRRPAADPTARRQPPRPPPGSDRDREMVGRAAPAGRRPRPPRTLRTPSWISLSLGPADRGCRPQSRCREQRRPSPAWPVALAIPASLTALHTDLARNAPATRPLTPRPQRRTDPARASLLAATAPIYSVSPSTASCSPPPCSSDSTTPPTAPYVPLHRVPGHRIRGCGRHPVRPAVDASPRAGTTARRHRSSLRAVCRRLRPGDPRIRQRRPLTDDPAEHGTAKRTLMAK